MTSIDQDKARRSMLVSHNLGLVAAIPYHLSSFATGYLVAGASLGAAAGALVAAYIAEFAPRDRRGQLAFLTGRPKTVVVMVGFSSFFITSFAIGVGGRAG